MAIPGGTALDELLDNLTLRTPSDLAAWKAIELVPEHAVSDAETLRKEPPVVAWYPAHARATPEALCKRIGVELSTGSHPSTDEICRAVLALVCVRRPGIGGLEALQRLLQSTRDVEFSDYFIAAYPPHPDVKDFTIGDFRVGRLDREKLVWLCDRVGCDYFRRYPYAFRNRFSISRTRAKGFAIRIREVGIFCETPSLDSAEYRLVDNYFGELAKVRREILQREFMEEQYVPVAAGAVVVDIDDPRMWFGSSFVSLITWKDDDNLAGYFCPHGTGMHVDFASVDKSFAMTIDALRQLYGYERLGTSELHGTIRTFCKFVSAAALRRKEAGLRTDESFLYYVIALDLLFGEKDASNVSISSRVAVVCGPALNESITSVMERVRKLYDLRSRFVHAGHPIPETALDQIDPLIKAVFSSLMRLQRNPRALEPGWFRAWVAQLDFFYAAHKAGQPLPPEKLEEAGIISALR